MGKTVLFNRYRLLEPAGSGGSAEVWRARDERTGDEVALKRLHPIIFGSESGRRRLAREFRALQSLRHPSIVRVRDLKFARDEGAIILDYVDGPSLADRLGSGPPLAPAEAVAIASDVASALAAAHAEGIVHRDVTPANILLDRAGRAQLTDFGIARQDGDETVATGTGLLVGTLRYIAPEQLRGEAATAASDLFALGAVTYEMLAGRPAFAAATPVALVEAQHEEPPRIEGVPAAVDTAVRTALSAEPSARQDSVETFAEQLRSGIAEAADTADAESDAPTAAIAAPGIAALWAGTSPAPPATPVARAAPATARRPVRWARAPLVGLVALVFGALVVAALAPRDGTGANAAGTGSSPAVTAEPTSPPAPNDNKGKGEGKGKDKKDKGEGND